MLTKWKYPFILLFGIGISNVGAWVYLIALNLMVFDMTGSPLAVAALYILIPLATLFTNFWAGSFIDRFNKRTLMVIFDLFRAVCIVFLPMVFEISLWLIYVVVFFINMAGSMFSPASMTYITKLIPQDQRKRFNSLRSLIDSGAFLIGPAIAGILFFIGTPVLAIYINASALLISALLTLLMPNLEKRLDNSKTFHTISFDLLKEDWKIVLTFSRRSLYIMSVYFLFSGVLVMTEVVDSLEAVFAKEVLNLSNSEYGFLVSIAGLGIIIGAFVNTIFVKKIDTSLLIGVGSIFVSVGYVIYAFSQSFFMAALGFFILAFFLSFANTGFLTFYQNNIPVEVMGRVGSIYGFVQALFVIAMTLIFALAAQIISVQLVVIAGSLIMLLIAIALCVITAQPSKRKYYQNDVLKEAN
ncbi:MFS transporter [Bacillus shivajii]|uniref:MFS transporter n=1 Tax=Bacillus shivajii TaxID=1983719 RepID=UPI001CF9E62B|nr:MFS transporter [Bacillus shivajii]UCZ55205.1 MFS transporter [Bacillus shivajii]